MRIGQRVMLICRLPDDSDDPVWPPVGAIGHIYSELDRYGDYDVMFEGYPCPTALPDESWVVAERWVVPVDEIHTRSQERLTLLKGDIR